MRISDYKNLIEALPVDQHSFDISSKNWIVNNQKEKVENIFQQKEFITLNRYNLINSTYDLELFALKTLMWGYPTKGRGSNIHLLLENDNFDLLISLLISYRSSKISLAKLIDDIKNIKGLGKSTITKFLYFLDTNIEGYGAIIFDEKVIRVLKSGRFDEFNQFKGLKTINLSHYIDYLSVLYQIANEMHVDADKIELFLFLFGNNLSELKGENCYDDVD